MGIGAPEDSTFGDNYRPGDALPTEVLFSPKFGGAGLMET